MSDSLQGDNAFDGRNELKISPRAFATCTTFNLTLIVRASLSFTQRAAVTHRA